MAITHVHCQLPHKSARTPCKTGNTAPPNTPIMNTPDALEVYCPSPLTANVNMQLHMTEWHNPTDTSTHKLPVRMAANMSMVAITVVAASRTRGET